MGSMATEALKASETMLSKGVYANVIVITSPDLLIGIQGHETGYHYLKQTLGVSGDLHLTAAELSQGELAGADLITVAGRRIPVVSVHDGEAGLLDNIGSIIGVKQISLAVRKHSKCGRPDEIYHFHDIDADAVVEACDQALMETALEQVKIPATILNKLTLS
jgi:pyruvate dehydrogenase E1 component